ncbi:uncharacterized protein TNCV_1454661 [Trichonephila clavipes]|nr:uncharacterized protein TNCV_1454661 [Trichonephila clavipes]
MNFTRQNPPSHHRYAAMSPGLSLQCRISRAHQMALARLRSGHLRGMTFVHGVKSFFICPYSLPASPAHLPDCWGIYLRELFEDQDLFSNRRASATDHVILNQGQVTWTTPELAPPSPNYHTTPREDVSALDSFKVHRCRTRRVCDSGLELMTCLPAMIRYLDHCGSPSVVKIDDNGLFEEK